MIALATTTRRTIPLVEAAEQRLGRALADAAAVADQLARLDDSTIDHDDLAGIRYVLSVARATVEANMNVKNIDW